jgi:serine phosphatase RsbU (regulator of sigma subunit)/putative methionine-R-sulfoxide reductase with GAF domain
MGLATPSARLPYNKDKSLGTYPRTMESDNNNLPPETSALAQILTLTARVEALEAELRRQEAAARESSQLYAQAHARLRELSALNKVTRALIATTNLSDLLNLALRQAVQITQAEGGSLMLLESDGLTLRIAASSGIDPEIVESAGVRIGDGIAGWVAQHQKPLVIPNIVEDARFRNVTSRPDISSAMCVPILSKQNVLGVLNVSRSEGARPYSSQDLQLLTTLAGQISLALQNARLLESAQRRFDNLTTLMDLVGQLNSTLSAAEVMDIIVSQSQHILKADACVLFLRDERRDSLHARAYRGVGALFARKLRARPGHGRIGEVVVSGEPEYIPDVSDPRLECSEDHCAEGLCCALMAPIWFGGQGIGALVVYSRTPRRVQEDEVKLLMAIASQGAIAINNAVNYQQQRDIALLVQRNLQPQISVSAPNLEIGHCYVPAKEVGGDYYDAFDLPDGRIGIVMADVAGKSVAAAVHTAKGKYFIRALAYGHNTPSEVLTHTNHLISADMSVESFISVVYGVLDPRWRTLRYCNAGHPTPFVVTRRGEIRELTCSNMLIGIMNDERYTDETVHLHRGDALVLTTDGVTEARGADGLFGAEMLREFVSRNASMEAQSLAEALRDEIGRFSGNRVQDDVAVLIVRVH